MLELFANMGKDVLVEVLNPVLREGSERAKEWIRNYLNRKHDTAEVPEMPPEVENEVNKAVQSYFESPKYPVYMDGVIFFFQETLDEELRQELRDIIGQYEEDLDESAKEEEFQMCQLLLQYMGVERGEEDGDFGFEENFLYLNFYATREATDRLFHDGRIREMADALNQLLPEDNQIESFRTF